MNFPQSLQSQDTTYYSDALQSNTVTYITHDAVFVYKFYGI